MLALALAALGALTLGVLTLMWLTLMSSAAARDRRAMRELERRLESTEQEIRLLRLAMTRPSAEPPTKTEARAVAPAPPLAEPAPSRVSAAERPPAAPMERHAPPQPPVVAPPEPPPVAPPAPIASPPVIAAAEPPSSDQGRTIPTNDQRLRPTTNDQRLRPTTNDQRPTTDDRRPTTTFDWENLVGVKLFSWIAAIALALAGVFFLRYSIQAGWLQPPVRMAIGILVGLALVAGCEVKAAREYPVTANALDAAGIVILFSTFFAAFALWHLIGVGAAFLCLILVTAAAVLLSIRRESLFIAILGLIGGFLTPALLSTGQDNPVGLFGYLLVLNAGLSWVAYRKGWALLTAASLALTTLYQWTWVGAFLAEAKLPVAAGIFLVFPVLNYVALTIGDRRLDEAKGRTFALTAATSAMLPLLFAWYLAAVPLYASHTALLFGFLFCLDAGLLASAIARRTDLLHLVGAVLTNVISFYYLALSYRHAAWPGILAAIAALVLLYLAAPWIARRFGRPFQAVGHRAALGGAVLLFAFPFLIALEPATASPAFVFAVLFALLAAASAHALLEAPRTAASGAVHFTAAFFALGAEAVWSGRFLTDARLGPALVIYLAFALFYIGVPLLARRIGRALAPQGAAGAILLISLAVLFFPAGALASGAALWGMALLLTILNVAVFAEGRPIGHPALSLASGAVSWLVICVWWTRASPGGITGPGLLVVAAFAVLMLGGHAWSARRPGGEMAANGLYLGLVGHVFLLFVAGRAALSIPPWPLLATLFVLDLAIGIAALWARHANFYLAAIAASPMILLAWLSHATAAPWPAVAIASSAALALLAAIWMRVARATIGAAEHLLVRIDAAGALALVLALVVVMFACPTPGAPAVAWLTFVEIAILAAVLALATFRRWYFLALVALVPATLALAIWHASHPDAAYWQLLLLSGGIYLAFFVYPLVLGPRVGAELHPHVAAVLASAVFFFAARHSLLAGGFGSVIGILPLFQALLMAVLLVHLLRLEAPGTRARGRLALVAGAALAFVTVAIPLQLEKEWITIGWALEGAALAWLYGRILHRGLLLAATGLLAAVFVRLAFNPAVLLYQPRGPYRIWNWYLYTYLTCAAAMLAAARLFRTTDDALGQVENGGVRARSLAASAGTVLLFLLLNIEIADFYSSGPSITFNLSATLAQDVTYTLGWGVFAVGLLVAGIAIGSHAARVGAIALLAVTVVKGFLHDLARLGGLYRVASFVGLAICLALVAVVLQKFVLRPRGTTVRE